MEPDIMTVSPTLRKPYRRRVVAVLFVALFLASFNALVFAVGYFGTPMQQMETRAELLRSQRTNAAISDEEIDRHISRVASQSYIFGLGFVISAASGCLVLVAMSLLEKMPSGLAQVSSEIGLEADQPQ